jgi:pimeloyl-ACP methyl ester carboxylesterase
MGKGKPMLLCNRFRGNLDSWDPAFLNALAKHHQVITFDWSGFGVSTGSPPQTISAFASDVKELSEALGHKEIILVGWSFGGMVAQTVLTQFPETVSHTILIGTNPPGNNDYAISEVFLEKAWKHSNDLADEMVLYFEPNSKISRKAAKKSNHRIRKRTGDLDSPIPESLWDYYRLSVKDYVTDTYQSRAKLATTKIPMLIITADHEICFPAQNWFALTQALPTAQLMVFPQAGHGVQHQYPKLIARYIRDFIKMS